MPDLPREGPGGRLDPPGGGEPDDAPSHVGLLDARQSIPVAAALLAAGALLVLGQETDTLATNIGDLSGDTRSFEIAVYTATVLGTVVCLAVAAAATAVRGSGRWQAAGWAAILVLSVTRLLGTAPLLFWRLGTSAGYSVPLWVHVTSAVTWLVATLLLLAGPPAGRTA